MKFQQPETLSTARTLFEPVGHDRCLLTDDDLNLTHYLFNVFVQIQVLCVPALHHLPQLCHNELWTSQLFVKSFNLFPENPVQLPFHFVTSVLGFVEIALHLFKQPSCFVLLFPSLWSCSCSSLISMTAASTILYSFVSRFTLSLQLLFHVSVPFFALPSFSLLGYGTF